MPISRDEAFKILKFGKGREPIDKMKTEILNFLKENKRDAWSFIEIYKGIKGSKDKILPVIESTLELLIWSSEKEQYFEALLDLIDEEKVIVIDKDGELYYIIAE